MLSLKLVASRIAIKQLTNMNKNPLRNPESGFMLASFLVLAVKIIHTYGIT